MLKGRSSRQISHHCKLFIVAYFYNSGSLTTEAFWERGGEGAGEDPNLGQS